MQYVSVEYLRITQVVIEAIPESYGIWEELDDKARQKYVQFEPSCDNSYRLISANSIVFWQCQPIGSVSPALLFENDEN